MNTLETLQTILHDVKGRKNVPLQSDHSEMDERWSRIIHTIDATGGNRQSSNLRSDRKGTNSHGGIVIDLLNHERKLRNMTQVQMAHEIGFTYGYFSQLRNGLRNISEISPRFTLSCARFLGVEPILIKIASGQVEMSDFVKPVESEDASTERSIRGLKRSSVFQGLPTDAKKLSIQEKRELLMRYEPIQKFSLLGVGKFRHVLQRLQQLTTDCLGQSAANELTSTSPEH